MKKLKANKIINIHLISFLFMKINIDFQQLLNQIESNMTRTLHMYVLLIIQLFIANYITICFSL